MPCVLNKATSRSIPAGAVFIGRPSKWGNPFVIGRDGDRAQVIKLYREYITTRAVAGWDIQELRGKDLVCYCAPLACHGDVLLELANGPDPLPLQPG